MTEAREANSRALTSGDVASRPANRIDAHVPAHGSFDKGVRSALPNTPMKPRSRSRSALRTGGSLESVAFVVALLVVAATLAACSTSDPSTSGPLATYHADNSRTGYSTDSRITTVNAASLTLQWSKRETAAISAQAIVNDGVIYWGDWNGIEHATTTDGKSLWSTSIGIARRPSACPFKQAGPIGVVSTATVGEINGAKALWVGGGNGRMYALNASTGAVIWQTQLGSAPLHVLWSSPAYFDGSIYEGVASWNDCPDINGKLVRMDAATGTIQATFTPSVPVKCVGVGIWSSVASDPSTNAIYVGTGPTYLPVRLRPNPAFLPMSKEWSDSIRTHSHSNRVGPPAATRLDLTSISGRRRCCSVEQSVAFVVSWWELRTRMASVTPSIVTIWPPDRFRHTNVENAAALNSTVCEDRNTISTSSWAGQSSPVIVAGIAVDGSTCIGTVTALDASTGSPIWQVPVGGVVQGAVTEVPGLVAVGAGPYLQVLSSASRSQPLHLPRAGRSRYRQRPRRRSFLLASTNLLRLPAQSSETRTATSEYSACREVIASDTMTL